MRTKRKSQRVESTTPRPDAAILRGEVMFDLDGTLAENTWPETHIGEPIQAMVSVLLEYRAEGYACSIFTSRPEDHRERVLDWLYANGLDFEVYRVIMDKPVYGLLIDDRSWNPWHTTPPSKKKSKKRS